MAQAMFIDLRGKKKTSALIMVKKNALMQGWTAVYVPKAGLDSEYPELKQEKGELFTIPDGFTTAPLVDSEGNEITTKPDENGEVAVLQQLVY